MTGPAYGQQKTHSRFQPWVLVKIYSISTRANGLAYYEDYQRYLSENSVHYGLNRSEIAAKRSSFVSGFLPARNQSRGYCTDQSVVRNKSALLAQAVRIQLAPTS
jgi:hypothetical protein